MSFRLSLSVPCAIVVVVGSSSLLCADVLSIDATSPTVTSSLVSSGDILGAGPHVHVPIATLGGIATDDLDALSGGFDSVDGSDVIYFSVDRLSQGAFILNTGDSAWDNATVRGQALLNQQAGDIFTSVDEFGVEAMPGSGMHLLMKNQRTFGLAPTGGTIFNPIGNVNYNNANKPQDNLNAYSQEEFDVFGNDGIPDRPVFFSAVATSPSLVAGGGSGADIMVYDPINHEVNIFASADMLGLQPEDDIDALSLSLVYDYDTGLINGAALYFSLAPGSPSLGNLYSPADVFMATLVDLGQGLQLDIAPFVRYDHASLGLLFDDNIDALETNAYIPEPATLALFAAAGLMMAPHRRRKA